jgi:hypothetical protein
VDFLEFVLESLLDCAIDGLGSSGSASSGFDRLEAGRPQTLASLGGLPLNDSVVSRKDMTYL